MTPPAGQPSRRRDAAEDAAAEVAYLRTPQAIRARAEALYRLGARGELAHFAIDESELPALAERVVRVTRAAYPDVRAIPNHTRFRHFGVGGVDRVARLRRAATRGAARARKLELAITSVLLDAGAGERWSYREPGGADLRALRGAGGRELSPVRERRAVGRSGAGSAARRRRARLRRFSDADLARAFQVSDDNPLVGSTGAQRSCAAWARSSQRGRRSSAQATAGESTLPRLGHLGVYLTSQAQQAGGALPARAVLGAVLEALGEIWPGRETCAGINLGDVWRTRRSVASRFTSCRSG